MQTLTIEKPVPFVARPGPVMLLLAGCGGTGSHIAQSLARIAAHTRESRTDLRIIFCDGDTVEPKNVGRQLFTPGDVGKNKAQVLAQRFSALFGLAIEALPEMATTSRLAAIGGRVKKYSHPPLGILIGAVDTSTARTVLQRSLRDQGGWQVWLDCGNHEDSGQVCVGTETEGDALETAIKLGICTKLPAPSLIYPDLLTAKRQPQTDCAAAMEDNIQSLMVNQMMAAIASEYLYKLVIQRRLTTFATTVDLHTLAMRSTPITASAIERIAAGAPHTTSNAAQKKARAA
jgi:PRTRC genetic system ThiF family protein